MIAGAQVKPVGDQADTYATRHLGLQVASSTTQSGMYNPVS
jgi:hypothetical protein